MLKSEVLFKSSNLILIFIVFIAATLRLYQLGIVPSGVTHDELGYIFNSYSIAKTGENVFGEFLPLFTWLVEGGFPFLPVPIYFSIPFYWLFDISATVGRLPSALLGVADIFLLYALVLQIMKNKPLAFLSSFFLAISPWHLHFSRSAYDPNFSFFFYLLGVVLFFWEIKKERLPLFSLLSFLLAVYSYRGMNIIFIPLIIALLSYSWIVLKAKKKQIIVFCLGVFVILGSLVFVLLSYGERYIAEAKIWEDPKMQESLDTQIRESQGPLSIRRFFLNKPTYIVNKLRDNYIKAYSPEFLFLYSEPRGTYSMHSQGRIYFIDLFFIILGLTFLYKKNKHAAIFFSSLALISGLPGAFSGMPYSARNFFLSAILPVFSASGVYFFLASLRKSYKILGILFVIVIYSYSLGSYLFDYYGRYALQQAEDWAKSLRDVSKIVINNKNSYNKIIIGDTSFGDVLQYALYAKLHPKDVQNTWQKNKVVHKDYFVLKNIYFLPSCIKDKDKLFIEAGEKVIYIVRDSCKKDATPSSYIRDFYRNIVWKIYK